MRLGNASTPLSGGVNAGNDIYTTNWDGSDTVTVKTFVNRTVGFPRWSPDGRRIAFLDWSQMSGGMLALYVMDADGQNERHVGWSTAVWGGLDWYDDSIHLLCLQYGTYPLVINVDTLSVPWSGRNPNLDELNLPVGASLGGVATRACWFNPLPVNPAAPPLQGLHFIYNELATSNSGTSTRSFISMKTQTGISLPASPNPTEMIIPWDGGVHSGTQIVGSMVAIAPNRDGFVYFNRQLDPDTLVYQATGQMIWSPVSGSEVALWVNANASAGYLMFSPDQTLVTLGAGVGSSVYNWQDFLTNGATAVRLGGFPTATSSGPGHWHFAAA